MVIIALVSNKTKKLMKLKTKIKKKRPRETKKIANLAKTFHEYISR